jgi:hypothetical protein
MVRVDTFTVLSAQINPAPDHTVCQICAVLAQRPQVERVVL